jgi:GTP-binding protein LepA
MATKAEYEVTEIGAFAPFPRSVDSLGPGEVGFFSAGIKSVNDTKVGDTITHEKRRHRPPLSGFKEVKPMVFCGIFPTDNQYPQLRDALDKLQLNDSALQWEPETSEALGFGFRCGFLGLLHMEIVQERLEREYNLDLITTAPSVVYQVYTTGGRSSVREPLAPARPGGSIRSRSPSSRSHPRASDYVGAVIKLCEERRGEQKAIQYASPTA